MQGQPGLYRGHQGKMQKSTLRGVPQRLVNVADIEAVGEVRLMLPAGSYRLITGLYNPATGQRQPLLNEAGEPIGDSIFVTEVNLP